MDWTSAGSLWLKPSTLNSTPARPSGHTCSDNTHTLDKSVSSSGSLTMPLHMDWTEAFKKEPPPCTGWNTFDLRGLEKQHICRRAWTRDFGRQGKGFLLSKGMNSMVRSCPKHQNTAGAHVVGQAGDVGQVGGLAQRVLRQLQRQVRGGRRKSALVRRLGRDAEVCDRLGQPARANPPLIQDS